MTRRNDVGLFLSDLFRRSSSSFLITHNAVDLAAGLNGCLKEMTLDMTFTFN